MRVLMLAQSFCPVVGGEERVVEDLSRRADRPRAPRRDRDPRQPGRQPVATAAGRSDPPLRSSRLPNRAAARDAERRHAPPAARSRDRPRPAAGARRGATRHRPCPQLDRPLLPAAGPADAGAALVLSLHDYGLLCATKRLLRQGVPLQRARPGQVRRLRREALRARSKGLVAATGTGLRRVARFGATSTSSCRSARSSTRFCRLFDEESQVMPNFIGEPAAALPCRTPRLDRAPDGAVHPLLRRHHRRQGRLEPGRGLRQLDEPPPLVLIGRCYLDGLAERPGVHVLGPWPHELVIEALRRSMFTSLPRSGRSRSASSRWRRRPPARR